MKFIQQGQMSVYTHDELSELKQELLQLKDIESYLHGDVAAKNFKFTASSCYLIDFEQLGYGLRIFDLIDGMIEFSMQKNHCSKDIASAFFDAYIEEYALSKAQMEHFNASLKILIMAKITRLYRSHLVFNYDLNKELIKGLKNSYQTLAVKK